MTNEDFIKLLKNHDWHYQYANGEAYNRGRDSMRLINAAKRDNPELQKIYDEYVEAMKR